MKQWPLRTSFTDMRENEFDATVVEARCARSPATMLLARKALLSIRTAAASGLAHAALTGGALGSGALAETTADVRNAPSA
jgi:hypothetical protein